MRTLCLVTIFSLNLWSAAAVAVSDSAVCNYSGGQIRVRGNEVTLGERVIHLGAKEKIAESSAVNSGSFLGQGEASCYATSYRAAKSPNGEVTILELHRARSARAGGILCRFSSDVGAFANPHAYRHIVLSPTADGRFRIKTLDVTDASGRPDLNADQLMEPGLAEGALAGFVAEQKAQPNARARVADELCGSATPAPAAAPAATGIGR